MIVKIIICDCVSLSSLQVRRTFYEVDSAYFFVLFKQIVLKTFQICLCRVDFICQFFIAKVRL